MIIEECKENCTRKDCLLTHKLIPPSQASQNNVLAGLKPQYQYAFKKLKPFFSASTIQQVTNLSSCCRARPEAAVSTSSVPTDSSCLTQVGPLFHVIWSTCVAKFFWQEGLLCELVWLSNYAKSGHADEKPTLTFQHHKSSNYHLHRNGSSVIHQLHHSFWRPLYPKRTN